MAISLTDTVGIAAAIASTASFGPQAWRIIKSRDVEGLSTGMYALTVFGFACWLTYGVLKADWALMVPNALCLALALFILTMIVLPPKKRDDVAGKIESAVGAEDG
jgi:MtN3 and saliva related transmembrane protein